MEKSFEILITTVARAVENSEAEEQFQYRSKTYKKLLDWEHFDKLLGKLNCAGNILFVYKFSFS